MPSYRNPGPIEFDAVLQRGDAENSQAYVIFPQDVRETFGTAGRIPVLATFDDEEYRGSLVTYGGGDHLILVLKSIRERLGKDEGDTVRVTISLDTTPRVVELADDARTALEESGALDAFRAMSYSHQREYERWIEEVKRPETRARRISKTIEKVNAGQRLR
ncbi:YdeI/OmpD-associated family protein [Leifsonia poae]|uniref:YdeI/OmpD-associated family protein n=1 Tax=Leifsonia poae TaxID=110933 RepID=UPI001CC1686E|nr:YdeI/OmpD-associated family protein [Leifsonia poae]